MTDQDSPMDDRQIERLRALAASVEPTDFDRVEPPATVWNGLESQAGAAVPLESAGGRTQDEAGAKNPWVLRAAAVLVVACLGAAAIASLNRSSSSSEVVAGLTLVNDGLPVASDSTAVVELIDDDGQWILDIDLSSVPDAGDGALELWVIDTEVVGMHSLGSVGGDGRFVLPDDVDPADFPVVDISIEPDDGDPTHSGQSVLRGVLDL